MTPWAIAVAGSEEAITETPSTVRTRFQNDLYITPLVHLRSAALDSAGFNAGCHQAGIFTEPGDGGSWTVLTIIIGPGIKGGNLFEMGLITGPFVGFVGFELYSLAFDAINLLKARPATLGSVKNIGRLMLGAGRREAMAPPMPAPNRR
ncbi:hypothetical protein VM1G_11990 [Cytospora mali]|uniref:Uncharacterized protein n=1 Tax=Cytospora mali TaxID=578113 RepID=A0A194VHE0_CYTMA|nr:hypothetical protein VM1G_11990 [Valsa mali]